MPYGMALIHKEIDSTCIKVSVPLVHIKFPYKKVETGWRGKAMSKKQRAIKESVLNSCDRFNISLYHLSLQSRQLLFAFCSLLFVIAHWVI
jgi:hypothetical protein